MKKLFAFLIAVIILPVAGLAETILCAGGSFGLVRDEVGNIWGWGDNRGGQYGDGSRASSLGPVPAGKGLNGADVADIEAGNENTLFLMKDGTVYTTGNDNFGQQGLGKRGVVSTPERIPELENIVKIDCGFGQCMALDSDGHLWAWGRNNVGQLGLGHRQTLNHPVQMSLENIVDFDCGGKFCMALDAEGHLWGWGTNEYGQLLNAVRTGQQTATPVLIETGLDIVRIYCGGSTAYALDRDGVLWSWGRNDYKQQGQNEVPASKGVPARVMLPEEMKISKIRAYNTHVALITEEGALWQWGGGSNGQFGTGKSPNGSLPVECLSSGVLDVHVGSQQTYIMTEDGKVYGSGLNKYGQIGNRHNRRTVITVWADTGLNALNGTVIDPE